MESEILIIGAIYFAHFFWSIKKIPLDMDAANHLRLAQLWVIGCKPSHSYRWGVKRGIIELYRILWPILQTKFELHRSINYLGFGLSHLVLDRVLDHPGFLPHLILVLICISPLTYSYSSSLDFLAVPLLVSSLWSLQWTGSDVLWGLVFVILVFLISILWKLSYLLFLPLVFALNQGDWLAVIVLSGIALFFALPKAGKLGAMSKTPLLLQVLKYRETRRLLRKKVLIPLATILILSAIILLASVSQEGSVRALESGWIAWIVLFGSAYVIFTGDYLTGPSSFMVTFPTLLLACSTLSSSLQWIILFFFGIWTIAGLTKIPGLRLEDSQRIFAIGDRYPTNREGSRQAALQIQKEVPPNTSVLFQTSDTLIGLYASRPSPNGCAYTLNHVRLWNIDRCGSIDALKSGHYVFLTTESPEIETIARQGFMIEKSGDSGFLAYPT